LGVGHSHTVDVTDGYAYEAIADCRPINTANIEIRDGTLRVLPPTLLTALIRIPSWTPPQPSINLVGMALTNIVLFVATSPSSSTAGVTFAIDLTSHLPVWSYPMTGTMALSKEGALYIVQGPKVAAIAVR
jgi:hypothetical protein